MTTTKTKAAAWRRAAEILRRAAKYEFDDEDAHIIAAVVPSLERRAEIIERRWKVGR